MNNQINEAKKELTYRETAEKIKELMNKTLQNIKIDESEYDELTPEKIVKRIEELMESVRNDYPDLGKDTLEIISNNKITLDMFKKDCPVDILIAFYDERLKEIADILSLLLDYLLCDWYGKYEPDNDTDYIVACSLVGQANIIHSYVERQKEVYSIFIYKGGEWLCPIR